VVVPDRDVTPDGGDLVVALSHLVQAEEARRRIRSERLGLSANDQEALVLVVDQMRAGSPARAGDIGAALGISTASVTVLVNRLERAGLARRGDRFPDRRSFAIEPTPEGTATAGQVRQLPDQALRLLRDLPPAEIRRFAEFAHLWADALRSDTVEPQPIESTPEP
jgi:DNA-binding MarR family transcriptional regulator